MGKFRAFVIVAVAFVCGSAISGLYFLDHSPSGAGDVHGNTAHRNQNSIGSQQSLSVPIPPPVAKTEAASPKPSTKVGKNGQVGIPNALPTLLSDPKAFEQFARDCSTSIQFEADVNEQAKLAGWEDIQQAAKVWIRVSYIAARKTGLSDKQARDLWSSYFDRYRAKVVANRNDSNALKEFLDKQNATVKACLSASDKNANVKEIFLTALDIKDKADFDAALEKYAGIPKPAARQTLLDITGSGTNSTQSFTAAKDWDLSYNYDCTGFGQQGNFQIFIQAAGKGISSLIPVNQLGLAGSGVEHYHTGGEYYLEVNSECSWHIRASG